MVQERVGERRHYSSSMTPLGMGRVRLKKCVYDGGDGIKKRVRGEPDPPAAEQAWGENFWKIGAAR